MPGKRIDYIEEVGYHRAKHVVERIHSEALTNTKGCWIFSGSKNTDGYGQVFMKPNSRLQLEGRKAQKAFLLHILGHTW
jgi:hypothetical protein